MAQTQLRSSSNNSATSGTAASVSAPTGTAVGDLVLVVVHCNGQTTIVDNNGATVFAENLNDYQPNTTAGHTMSVFSRRIIAGDPATYNFTIGATGRWNVTAICIKNPHPSIIYDVSPAGGANRDSTVAATVNANSITTTTNSALHIIIGCIDTSTLTMSGTPAGYTVIQNSSPNQTTTTMYKVISAAGATGALTFTASGNEAMFAASLAVRAAELPTTLNNYQFVSVGDGMSASEKIR